LGGDEEKKESNGKKKYAGLLNIGLRLQNLKKRGEK